MSEFWCKHILAAILYRARFPEKVPVHSPMMETLSNMSRDQLMKLVQFTVNINASHMILPLYQTIGELRDPESDTSRAHGAPDPTFDGSNGDVGKRLWQRSLKKLKSNFKMEIRESFIENPDTYFLRVTDLLHSNETYKAGEVLAVLATTLAGFTESIEDKINVNMCRDLDRLMTSFILSFDGKGREHLLDVLRGIHSSAVSSDNEEEEHEHMHICCDLKHILHFINLPIHGATAKPIDVKAEPEANFLFPQSLRAEKFKTISLHQLEKENFSSEISEEPIPVMLFRFHSLERLRPISCDLTNYGSLLLRKCIQLKEQMVSCFEGSRPFAEDNLGEDIVAGPSQLKVRRIDRIYSQHRKNSAVLSVNQYAFVTLYLLEKIYPDPPLYHSKGICMMVEAMLCLEVIERKCQEDLKFHLKVLLSRRWDVLTSDIEESMRNKSFVELYSSVFLKHWNASDTFYSNRNRNLLTLLTTTEDLPMVWRAQLCGNVVCSTLKIQSTMDLYSSEADVDVDEIVQMAALVAKAFIKDCIAECCDTVTKILEACLVCSNEVTCQRVFGVFWDYRSHLSCTKHNELMLCLFLEHLRFTDIFVCSSKGKILQEILTFRRKIGLQFAVVAFQKWEILSETFDMRHLSIIFNTICLGLKLPLPDDVLDALVSYLCAASHHDVECIDVLKAIPEGPRRTRALESVYDNADNYSCQALFHVARTAEENNSSIPLSDFNILSESGHQLLQKAFERYCNPTNADILQGRCLLTSHLVLDVLNWFFCRISEIGTEERAAGDQFQTFMHSIGNIFKFDQETQVSFLSHMQNSSSLLTAIREVVSEGGDIYINPYWYNWFSTT